MCKILCPSSDKIKKWVQIYEKKNGVRSLNGAEEEPRRESNKLSGTQWGRKTGENRIIRTESIDLGEQHKAIKYNVPYTLLVKKQTIDVTIISNYTGKQRRDIKWSGPRANNEIEEFVEPVVEKLHYNYYYYQEPVEKEVKPDKTSTEQSNNTCKQKIDMRSAVPAY